MSLNKNHTKNKISFIGFDLDGTLVDSQKAVYECLKESLPKYYNGNINQIIDIIFPLTMDQFPKYINFKSHDAFNSFKSDFINLFDKRYYKDIEKNRGCLELLKFCKRKFGEKNVFILTNRREKSALQVCNYLNISHIINTERIFSTKFNNSSNPKSASLNNLIKLLKIDNMSGYYVGDSLTDLDSAIENNINYVFISGNCPSSVIRLKYNLKEKINYFANLIDFARFLKK